MKRRRWLTLAISLAAVGYAFSGWTLVAPGEAAVVRRLGRVLPLPWGPGLHWGAPLGIDRVTKVRTAEVRRVALGLSGTPGARDEPGAGEYLTGDLNLLRAEASLQYRVSDPAVFTTRVEDVEPLLRRMAESALSRALAARAIDTTLLEGRAAAARDVQAALVRRVRRYGLGVTVLGVTLTDARPPTEVAPDFAAAQSAQSDFDRRANEAKTSASKTLTEAGSAARTRLEQAKAGADRTVAIAHGRTDRFTRLLTEVEKSRGLTLQRLYRDAVREILGRVRRKLILTPDEPIDLSIIGLGR